MGVVRRDRICKGWVGGRVGGMRVGWLAVWLAWCGSVVVGCRVVRECVGGLAGSTGSAGLVWFGLSLAWVWLGFGVVSSINKEININKRDKTSNTNMLEYKLTYTFESK